MENEEEKLIERKLTASNKKITKTRPTTTPNGLLAMNKLRHVNERRMAWLSLSVMVVLYIVVFLRVPPEFIDNYTGYLTSASIFFGAVVGAYMGFTTWGANKFFAGKGEVNSVEQVEQTEVETSTNQSAG